MVELVPPAGSTCSSSCTREPSDGTRVGCTKLSLALNKPAFVGDELAVVDVVVELTTP